MDSLNFFDNLSQDIWKKYGFYHNPFDTKALSSRPGEPLPVAKAIVGRGWKSPEFRLLTNILKTPGGGRVVIEGDIGVGKTTFMNYHRFLWENKAKDKLFTPIHEISVLPEWKVKDFLLNILGVLITKLTHVKPNFAKGNPLLEETLALCKVFLSTSFQVQGNILWGGGGFGKGREISLPQPSEAILLYYLESLVKAIKDLGYAGIILHFDDMELISRRCPQTIRNLLEDIRNILQLPDVYFIFIGHPGFFGQIISSLERVRSIFFGYPIHLPPLTKQETIEAMNRRYHLLAIKKEKFIKPVEDSFIEKLYDLYNGKIRFIMDAMTLVIPELSNPTTLSSKEGYAILKRLVLEKIQYILPEREISLLIKAARKEKFTNNDMSELSGLSAVNISHILANLQELNFIYLEQQVGRKRYYKVSEDVKLIRDVKEIPFISSTKSFTKYSKKSQKSMSRKTRERLKKAEAIIKEREKLTTQEYSKIVQVSLPTARRDLSTLVKMGKALRAGKGKQIHYIQLKE